MKDIIIGVLVVIIIINTIFIACCLKISSEVEYGSDDIESSKDRKRKANK